MEFPNWFVIQSARRIHDPCMDLNCNCKCRTEQTNRGQRLSTVRLFCSAHVLCKRCTREIFLHPNKQGLKRLGYRSTLSSLLQTKLRAISVFCARKNTCNSAWMSLDEERPTCQLSISPRTTLSKTGSHSVRNAECGCLSKFQRSLIFSSESNCRRNPWASYWVRQPECSPDLGVSTVDLRFPGHRARYLQAVG